MKIEIALTCLLLVASFGFADCGYTTSGNGWVAWGNQSCLATFNQTVNINTSDFHPTCTASDCEGNFCVSINCTVEVQNEPKTRWKEDCNTCYRDGNGVATCSLLACNVTLDYNSTSKIWTLTNDDGLPYFVNATSTFQTTESTPIYSSCESESFYKTCLLQKSPSICIGRQGEPVAINCPPDAPYQKTINCEKTTLPATTEPQEQKKIFCSGEGECYLAIITAFLGFIFISLVLTRLAYDTVSDWLPSKKIVSEEEFRRILKERNQAWLNCHILERELADLNRKRSKR